MKGSWLGRVCAISLMVGAAAIASPAQIFTDLVNFDGTDGSQLSPKSIVQGTDGNFYGTTYSGGANDAGTVFKMTPEGKLTTIHSFCSLPGCADGNGGSKGVILGADGNYYGVSGGGAYGDGEVYKISPSGVVTVLHSFDVNDGAAPLCNLVQGADGAFYGTTISGGNLGSCNGGGCGTVWKVTPGGKFTSLHSFCSEVNCADGATSFDGLAVGPDGSFYGGTWFGGANNMGTIYRITPEGTFTTLYRFCEPGVCPGGDHPLWLTLGNDGNFYGTTFGGGANGAGEVFEMTPEGAVSTVHSFCAETGCLDGSSPRGGLVLGSDGNFYGATYFGGANLRKDYGTVYQVTPTGTFTTLHSFDGVDGANPIGGLGQGTNGIFYGTTWVGGTDNLGVLFSENVGLGSSVQTAPGVGKVGQHILILGNDLTGATDVTFNGASVPFNVVSRTLITAILNSATSGPVQVVTPGGTLTSNVNFIVVP
jgi:uncharacterized repeat protein (TIGR03803 family)